MFQNLIWPGLHISWQHVLAYASAFDEIIDEPQEEAIAMCCTALNESVTLSESVDDCEVTEGACGETECGQDESELSADAIKGRLSTNYYYYFYQGELFNW